MRIKYFMVGFILIAIAAASGIAIALWVFQHFKIYIPLENQSVKIELQENLQAKVQLHDALDVNVTGQVKAKIPIRENLTIPIEQSMHPRVYFDNLVPIKTVIPVSETLVVNQDMPIDTHVKVRVLGRDITLPLKGMIPIKLNVPIAIEVPLEQKVLLKFDAPVQVDLKEQLKIPLVTEIDANVPITGRLNVPVKSALDASVEVKSALPVKIKKGDLVIPLNTLTLKKNDVEKAERTNSQIRLAEQENKTNLND